MFSYRSEIQAADILHMTVPLYKYICVIFHSVEVNRRLNNLKTSFCPRVTSRSDPRYLRDGFRLLPRLVLLLFFISRAQPSRFVRFFFSVGVEFRPAMRIWRCLY